jgi:hypothetical protein
MRIEDPVKEVEANEIFNNTKKLLVHQGDEKNVMEYIEVKDSEYDYKCCPVVGNRHVSIYSRKKNCLWLQNGGFMMMKLMISQTIYIY